MVDDITIIGVTGLPSSGKGVFSEVANQYQFHEIVMGDVIRNEVKRRGLEISRENSNKVMVDLRKERGENAVAEVTLDWIEEAIEQGHRRILIDGIRSMVEVEVFRSRFPDLILIAIHADPETRFKRSKERKREDDAYSRNSFDERDQIELNVGIGDVIALSDYLCSSVNDLSQVKRKFHEIISEILQLKKPVGVVHDG